VSWGSAFSNAWNKAADTAKQAVSVIAAGASWVGNHAAKACDWCKDQVGKVSNWIQQQSTTASKAPVGSQGKTGTMQPTTSENVTTGFNNAKSSFGGTQSSAIMQCSEITDKTHHINWETTSLEYRAKYVMKLLVDTYKYPKEAAAGIVGNLAWESGLLPNRIEGSSSSSPMNAAGFDGIQMNFTPDQVMNRDYGKLGPKAPGIGLAQWTYKQRREGLFKLSSGDCPLGSSILFNMDAQVEYLVMELERDYPTLNKSLKNPAGNEVTVNDASDLFVYIYEIPGSILNDSVKLPADNENVIQEFMNRRPLAQKALDAFMSS
jgi:hypothetical protein